MIEMPVVRHRVSRNKRAMHCFSLREVQPGSGRRAVAATPGTQGHSDSNDSSEQIPMDGRCACFRAVGDLRRCVSGDPGARKPQRYGGSNTGSRDGAGGGKDLPHGVRRLRYERRAKMGTKFLDVRVRNRFSYRRLSDRARIEPERGLVHDTAFVQGSKDRRLDCAESARRGSERPARKLQRPRCW